MRSPVWYPWCCLIGVASLHRNQDGIRFFLGQGIPPRNRPRQLVLPRQRHNFTNIFRSNIATSQTGNYAFDLRSLNLRSLESVE